MERQLVVPGELVKKDNSLIRLTIELGNLLCNRILAAFISCISVKDTDFQPVYKLQVKSLFSEKEYRSGYYYQDLSKACKELGSCIMFLEHGDVLDPSFECMPFFTKIHYENGVITAEFNKHCTPLLIQLKKNFTQYNLVEYCTLRSAYTQKVFEVLKSYENLGEIVLEVDYLCQLLNLPASMRPYTKLKTRVLLPAQKDIAEKTSLRFKFEPIRESHRFTKIRFILGTARKKIEVHQNAQQNLQRVNQLVSELAQEKRINTPHLETTEETPMSENEKAIRKLKSALAQKLGDGPYKVWIDPLFGKLSDGTLTLLTHSNFFSNYIEEHYYDVIKETASELFGETSVVIKTRDEVETV